MAGSKQMTNEELLDLITQTSSPNKNLPEVNEAQTVELGNNPISNEDNMSIQSIHCNNTNMINVSENSQDNNVAIAGIELNSVDSAICAEVNNTDETSYKEPDSCIQCDKCNGEGVIKTDLKEDSDTNMASSDLDIDTDLVSILSKDEIANLIHEYRTEIEDTKNKLTKSDRQLAKANEYNKTLRSMVEQLSGEIHRIKHLKTCDVHVQVDKEDLLNYTTGAMVLPSWNRAEDQAVSHMDTIQSVENNTYVAYDPIVETEGVSIADSIKQTAEAVVHQQHLTDSGYVFDQSSGLYYHPQSGYYYDQNKSLFYDPNTGTYYYYNYDMGTYEFHSQVDLQHSSQLQHNTQNVNTNQNSTEKMKPKETRRKERKPKDKQRNTPDRMVNTPDKKVFKNRRERRQAIIDDMVKGHRSSSTDRHRSKDRKSKRKKRSKHSDDESCDQSPSQSRCKSSKSKKHCKERKREKSSTERISQDDLEPSETKFENIDDEILDISDEDPANQSIDCIRNILKRKSKFRKNSDLQRSMSEDNLCSYDKNSADVNDEQLGPSQRHVRAQSEGRAVDCIQVSSNDSNDGEISESEPLPVDSGDNKSNNEEMLGDGKESVKDTETDERSSKRRKSSHKRKRKHKKKHHKSHKRSKKHKSRSHDRSDTESGELSDSDVESDIEDVVNSHSESGSMEYVEVSDTNDVNDGVVISAEPTTGPENKEMASQWPPCVRIIVTESDCVQIGTFFMITCTGGKIGRENCDVNIPDVNISKAHASITYNTESGQYQMIDLASQNGTFLNKQRLSPAKIASEVFVLSHGDSVQVGGTSLLCHIHTGTDTCDQCEPGVVLASLKSQQTQDEVVFLSKEERLRQKKLELKQIKKKYGLKNSAYEDNIEVFNNPNYTDKAEERRQTVGSDVPIQKHEAPASVHRPISSGNVGHKLLQKMGWKEGESLGKNNSGLQEPISVNLRANQTAGLGSSNAGGFTPEDANTVDMKKATRRIQAQQRYKQIDSAGLSSENTNSNKQWKQGDTEYS